MQFNPVRSSRASGPERTRGFAASATSNGVNPEIFKAYDIRGVYGKDFDTDFAFQLGAAFVRFLNRKNFLIANDSRDFSAELAESLMGGITSAGGDVEYIGESTMPFFYFVFGKLGLNGGVMITASHNEPEYGGFKIFGEDCEPIDLNLGLNAIRDLVTEGNFGAAKYSGKINRQDREEILKEYIEFVIKKSGVKPAEIEGLKIKAKGNQMAGREIDLLFKNLGIKNHETDFDPFRSSRASGPEGTRDFVASATSNGVDIAFSLDGDADRLTVFDRNNNRISPDFILGLLAKEEIGFFSKPKIVYDLRFSKGVLEKFDEWGVKSFRCRVGRTFIREEMIKHKANLGGELSGHLLFKKNNYFELPLMAMLKILKILGGGRKSIAELVEPFKTWFNSGEINIGFRVQGSEFGKIAEKLKGKFSDGKIDELDGVTVEYPSWWFNLRPSNTEPVLRLVVEAKTKESLGQKPEELYAFISSVE